jgi:hypothetical protein
MIERNMCSADMRGAVVPPGSKVASRANGSRWNLGGLVSGRRVAWYVPSTAVCIGKARSRSR